jgi:hypothetical protein
MVPQAPGAPRTARLSGAALVAALAVLIAFGVFVVFLVSEVDVSEVKWARLAWLFASVEAIAFGAAGALFGSSIQRQRAEKAETDAKENATAAANGRALAEAVKADEPQAGGGGGLESLGPGQQADAAAEVARRHAVLARRLFP